MVYIRYAFLALVLLVAVTVALANYGSVTLSAWPAAVTSFLGFEWSITLPLFVVVGASVGLGLLIGFAWEWLRERGYRAEAARLRRENEALRARTPVATGVPQRAGKGDDVLAILDEAPAR